MQMLPPEELLLLDPPLLEPLLDPPLLEPLLLELALPLSASSSASSAAPSLASSLPVAAAPSSSACAPWLPESIASLVPTLTLAPLLEVDPLLEPELDPLFVDGVVVPGLTPSSDGFAPSPAVAQAIIPTTKAATHTGVPRRRRLRMTIDAPFSRQARGPAPVEAAGRVPRSRPAPAS
jgi:hypothetical protein